LSTEASYQLQRWNASLAGHYVGESFSDAINTRDETANGGAGKLPDYVLLTARIGCDIVFGNERGMNLGVSVNNLLDEGYYFRGADVSPVGRVPSPGRSYLLTAKVGF
jgi:Fe(3+) dicitrate transport protein